MTLSRISLLLLCLSILTACEEGVNRLDSDDFL